MFKSLGVVLGILVSMGVHAQMVLQKSAEKALLSSQSTIQPGRTVQIRNASGIKEWGKISRGITSSTYLSIVSQPKAEDVENVVLISAGQQTKDPRNAAATKFGYPNVLTGQYRGYRKNCAASSHCKVKIQPDSLADRVIKSSAFPLSKTLMVLVFDSQFNHGRSDSQKAKIETAFWDMLTSRFQSGNVKKIFLAGQSKGGCLAFSLGKRFRHTQPYDKIPLIVQGYDPVCKTGRLGPKSAKTFFSNPLKKDIRFKSMYINMNQVFPAQVRKNLALLDIHSGAPVVDLGQHFSGVHSFTFRKNDTDIGWWKQTWVPYGHTEMGGNMGFAEDTVIPGFNHLMKNVAKFASYKPPGGGLLGGSAKKCPKVFPKRVGENAGKSICTAHLPAKIFKSKCTDRNAPGKIWANKYCIWDKGSYWHARPLKSNGGVKCPVHLSENIGTLNGKPMCKAKLVRKIKRKNCSSISGDYCVENKGSFYKARPLKD